jgi:hypothetical protein
MYYASPWSIPANTNALVDLGTGAWSVLKTFTVAIVRLVSEEARLTRPKLDAAGVLLSRTLSSLQLMTS